ncbi:T9SS type A sorting domain-containing protein [Mesonia aquimarina]|uniref:T9SS type A sorting domain-containing protein n=1 Tax=Mesonia aquimarina TaxID=1504967 RepID=UPI000EF5C705|nr:T9SS type A sorting domain-containing protein [Mesonia aquimarina]
MRICFSYLKSVLFIILTFFSSVLFSQQQIYLQDFETNTGYSTSVSEFIAGNDNDYFKRTNESAINASFTNKQGNYFFAAQNIDGNGNALPLSLSLNNINISSFIGLEVRVYLAEDDDGTNQDWDATDYVHILYDIDNSGAFTNLLNVESDLISGSNGEPGIDENFNGVANNKLITDNFEQFSVSIPSTGNNLDIKVEFDLNSGDEDIAIDHIEVIGFSSGTNLPPKISNIQQTPSVVNSSNTVAISSAITDTDGINTAVLKWGTNSSNLLNSIPLTNSSGDVYTTNSSIPAQPDGTLIYYQIEATDSNSNSKITSSNVQSYTVENPMPTSFIAIQSFDNEGPVWEYSTNTNFFNNGDDGFYDVIGARKISELDNPNFNQQILAENDLDNTNGNGTSGFATITFNTIDISTNTNVQLTFDYQLDGYNANNDDAKYELFYDGNSQGEVFILDGNGSIEDKVGEIIENIPNTVNQVSLKIAIRNNGNTGFSGFDNFSLEEITNFPPEISSVTQSPLAANVTSADAVTVSADITDTDGINSVEVLWGTSSGNLTNTIVMSSASGNIYTANTAIPAQPDGINIYYQIETTDNYSTPASSTSNEFNYEVNDPIPPPDLIITEVADPVDFSTSTKNRFVEIYNNGTAAIDLDAQEIYLAKYSNANNSTTTSIALTGIIEADDYFIIATDETNFEAAYGFKPDETGSITGNGDDPYALYIGGDADDGDLFDVYGEIGVDGTGEAWEYENSRAFRNSVSTSPTTIWNANEWTIVSGTSPYATPAAAEADYVFDSGSWSPITPIGNIQPDENIKIISGDVIFDQVIALNSLTLNKNASLAIESHLKLYGNLYAYGELLFKSNSITETGTLGAMDSSSEINGKVRIERFIPAKRAFRFLSSSVNTDNSINQNWQEGVHNTGTNFPADNMNPNDGFGTHITGDINGANGFDATLSGNPSLFFFNNINQSWENIPNTDTEILQAGKPYRILIRGSRAINVTDNNATPTDTKLRMNGELISGTQNFTNLTSNVNEFNFIGNPYQAVVDMNSVLSASINIDANEYYVWDPNKNTQGGYVTVTLPSGVNSDGSPANEYLQPHQAFFVAPSGGSNPEIIFEENHKVNSAHTTVFNGNEDLTMTVQLLKENQANWILSDSFMVLFNSNYSNQINQKDARKLGNIDENIALKNTADFLSVERRAEPIEGDSLVFFNSNYRTTNYRLKITKPDFENVKTYLYDDFLNQETELANGENSIDFLVDQAIEESISSERFSIYFEEELNINAYEKADVKMYPNPYEDGKLILEITEIDEQKMDLKIFNLLGAEVFKEQDKSLLNNKLVIQKLRLAPGIYTVQLIGNSSTSVKKLVVK